MPLEGPRGALAGARWECRTPNSWLATTSAMGSTGAMGGSARPPATSKIPGAGLPRSVDPVLAVAGIAEARHDEADLVEVRVDRRMATVIGAVRLEHLDALGGNQSAIRVMSPAPSAFTCPAAKAADPPVASIGSITNAGLPCSSGMVFMYTSGCNVSSLRRRPRKPVSDPGSASSPASSMPRPARRIGISTGGPTSSTPAAGPIGDATVTGDVGIDRAASKTSARATW